LKSTGPVVRTGPRNLSFVTATSWRDIYGKNTGKPFLLKSEAYDGLSFDHAHRGLISERNPIKHAKLRKFLAPGFSTKALLEQEEIIHNHIDILESKIAKYGEDLAGMDMHFWLHCFSFDVIGRLAFGKSFNSIETGMCLCIASSVTDAYIWSREASSLGR
jgi:cytochrome P450